MGALIKHETPVTAKCATLLPIFWLAEKSYEEGECLHWRGDHDTNTPGAGDVLNRRCCGRVQFIELAAEIVVAFVAHNSLPVAELPGLIAPGDAALRGLVGRAPTAVETEKPTRAVLIKKFVTPDYLICLDDGKNFKSLRRHLAMLGMKPDEDRAKWGLAPDYPMVAANYAAKRSDPARSLGLGQARKTGTAKRCLTPKAN